MLCECLIKCETFNKLRIAMTTVIDARNQSASDALWCYEKKINLFCDFLLKQKSFFFTFRS